MDDVAVAPAVVAVVVVVVVASGDHLFSTVSYRFFYLLFSPVLSHFYRYRFNT